MLAVHTSADHYYISDRFHQCIEEKITNLKRYDDTFERAEVTIHKNKQCMQVDVSWHRTCGILIHGSESAEGVYEALNGALSAVRKQIRRAHRKRIHLEHHTV